MSPGLLTPDLDRPSLLLVDDDDTFREVMQRALEKRGFAVSGARDVVQALTISEQDCPEYALVDLGMPGPSGFWLVRRLRELCTQTRVVVVSGWDRERVAVESIKHGARHYLTKPVSIDEVLQALGFAGDGVRQAVERSMPTDAGAWQRIEGAMRAHHEDVDEAARALGLHPRALRRMLRWAGRRN
jgi:two-component system response regulator RegA